MCVCIILECVYICVCVFVRVHLCACVYVRVIACHSELEDSLPWCPVHHLPWGKGEPSRATEAARNEPQGHTEVLRSYPSCKSKGASLQMSNWVIVHANGVHTWTADASWPHFCHGFPTTNQAAPCPTGTTTGWKTSHIAMVPTMARSRETAAMRFLWDGPFNMVRMIISKSGHKTSSKISNQLATVTFMWVSGGFIWISCVCVVVFRGLASGWFHP